MVRAPALYQDGKLRVLVVYDLLATHPRKKYKRIHQRKIERVYFHHTAGRVSTGLNGPRGTARTHVIERGWPGIAYHLYIPYQCRADDGVLEVYLTQPLDAWTWHTGASCNKHGIGIVLQGLFYSQHGKAMPYPGQPTLHPSDNQMEAAELVWRWLQRTFDLPASALSCHSLAPWPARKKSCPGDRVEGWVRYDVGGY